jgi:hypothetical protein
MIKLWRSLALDVEPGDTLAYLRSLPDGNLGAITCFHMIEHIPSDSVVWLLKENISVLQPGGLLILETSNPNNFMLASQSFGFDPTHLKPCTSTNAPLLHGNDGFLNLSGTRSAHTPPVPATT